MVHFFLEQVLQFSSKYPVTFGGGKAFLRSTRRTSSVFSYIGVTSNFSGLNSDRWQHSWKLPWDPWASKLGTSFHLPRSWATGLCCFLTRRLLCLTCFTHVALLHAYVSDLVFNKWGPYKGWVTEKKKKNPDGFTWQTWAVPSNSDVLLLPLHQIVSDFCIDEWQEKRLGGVDKGWKTEQKPVC